MGCQRKPERGRLGEGAGNMSLCICQYPANTCVGGWGAFGLLELHRRVYMDCVKRLLKCHVCATCVWVHTRLCIYSVSVGLCLLGIVPGMWVKALEFLCGFAQHQDCRGVGAGLPWEEEEGRNHVPTHPHMDRLPTLQRGSTQDSPFWMEGPMLRERESEITEIVFS